MNSAVLLLEEAANAYSEKIAIQDENMSLTYSQLRSKSRSIGTYLLNLQSKSSGVVSPMIVLMKKGVEAVAAFMGVLYSGNPYVPLDYEMPLSRLEKIIDNLSPDFIITDDEGKSKLEKHCIGKVQILVYSEMVITPPNDVEIKNTLNKVMDSEPIYIMYTSGSTGIPKGVVIPHRGVIDYAHWVKDTFDITPSTIMGSQAPFYFDNSVLDIYGAFASGATLVLIPNVLFQFPLKIPEYINDMGISFVFVLDPYQKGDYFTLLK